MKPPHSSPLTSPLALEFPGSCRHRVFIPKSLFLYPNKNTQATAKPCRFGQIQQNFRMEGVGKGQGGMTHSSREFGNWQLDPVMDGT